MRLTYDLKANVAYLCLREGQGDVETIALTADFLVDIDATGAVCGVELLNANEQLAAGDGGTLVLVDAVSGKEQVMKVA